MAIALFIEHDHPQPCLVYFLFPLIIPKVTKPRYFHKPTYDTLRSSLLALHKHCQRNGVGELCLPRIGCGLDRLQWDRVSHMIQEVFSETDIAITVYYL